jgi:hypothetical protein
VNIAKVPHAVLAELGCALSATSLPFHSFLGRDSEAADISYFDFFTDFEIGAQGWRGNRGWSRGGGCSSYSIFLGFGSCLRSRLCSCLGFALGFHGCVARTIGWANDSQCLTLTLDM